MADTFIKDLSGLARRRIGRTAQIEALPPQPARHDNSHWQFTRRGFVHGFSGARADFRMGKLPPELRAIQEAALAGGADPDAVEALTMDEVIVTPELISAEIGGVSWSTSRVSLRADAAPIKLPERSGVTGIARAWVDQSTSPTANVDITRAAHLPSKVWLNELSFSAVMEGDGTLTGRAKGGHSALGTLFGPHVFDEGIDGPGMVYQETLRPGVWLPSGSTIFVTYTNVNNAPGMTIGLTAVYEHAR